LASFLGFLIACGIGFDARSKRDDTRVIAFAIGGLLALNLVYLFTVPKPEKSRVRQLIGLWFDAKEKELRDRSKPS
jgi:hypothetical protein